MSAINTVEDYERYLESLRGSSEHKANSALYHTHITQEFLHHEKEREIENPKTHEIRIEKSPDWDGKTEINNPWQFTNLESFPAWIQAETGVEINDIIGNIIPASKGGGLLPNYKKNMISKGRQSRKEAIEALKQSSDYEKDNQNKQVEKL